MNQVRSKSMEGCWF